MKTHTKSFVPPALALAALVLDSSLIQPAHAASWTTNSAMTTARSGHTATLLPDGRVLVVGGNNSSGELSSAELYDPANRTWTPTGRQPTARNSHTATLLANGTVLVAAGYDNNGICGTAALYDPATGKWTATGTMTIRHYMHTMTLLANGKVLVAGGTDGTGTAKSENIIKSAELYDPSAGVWTATGSMTTPRAQHTATLLPNGKVLVAGGYNGKIDNNLLASAELYDPATGRWTVTGSLNIARCFHTATLLSNGKVLVAGGCGETDHQPASAELFDPATEKWTTTGALNNGRYGHTATLLHNGQVLISGAGSAELYSPATGTWTLTGSPTAARHFHTATLLPSGQVLVAGVFHSGSHLSSTELYGPATGN